MNLETEELIALGAAVAARCQPCLQHHIAQAREMGLAEEDILHALEIGRMVAKGADSAMLELEKQLLAEPANSGCCSSDSGCC